MRNLPVQHPVYKLMRRHCKYTLAINQGARVTLLAPNGVFDEFMSCGGPEMGHMKLALRSWAQWRFEHLRLPDDLRRRGVDDVTALPYYPYRDDALPLWRALGAYVRNTLGHFYASDQDLVDDHEMQDFWTDLITHGVSVERLPYASLARLEDLYDLLQTVIFTVTVSHSAVNNLQFEHYAWVPNAPLGLHRPPPATKGAVTEDDLREMLPDLEQTMGQIAIARALSTFGSDEEFLLPPEKWSRMYFYEPGPLAAQREFFSTLRAQVTEIEQKNKSRPVPYEILRPDRVPCSITI
jgi:arachidonate 5-lipoxygenase